MKIIFIIFVFIHGLIHLMGFAKAFQYGEITQLTKEIPKSMGLLWLLAALLFGILFFQIIIKNENWWKWAIAAVCLSQYLIFSVWQDAKFGTLINIIVLMAAMTAMTAQRFEKKFYADVQKHLLRVKDIPESVMEENDIRLLPYPVQQYLRFCGVTGKPKVNHFFTVFEGEMRDKGKDFFPFRSVQYNFLDEPTRLFFMKAKMFGMTVPGYHRYENGKAIMDIRLFGLLPIVVESGPVMDKTETVTLFNDICLLAPAGLIDPNIQWIERDSLSAVATFTNKGISITATLFFEQDGRLKDFISDDRTAVADMKQYPFSTPIHEYQHKEGRALLSKGDAVWHYPDGNFTYGKFNLKSIIYNPKTICSESE